MKRAIGSGFIYFSLYPKLPLLAPLQVCKNGHRSKMTIDWPHIVSITLVGSAAFALGVSAATYFQTDSRTALSSHRVISDETDLETLLMRSITFSAHKHRDQRRKNPSQIPYINHPLSVAHRLLITASIKDPVILAAAVLHDTLEDTDTTPAELVNFFGKRVASIVQECSDDKLLSKQNRKQMQIEHAPYVSPQAKLVKLADKLDNLADLLTDTPVGWTPQRVEQYFEWAEEVVKGLRGTSQPLEAALDDVFAKRKVAVAAAARSTLNKKSGKPNVTDTNMS